MGQVVVLYVVRENLITTTYTLSSLRCCSIDDSHGRSHLWRMERSSR